MLCQEKRAYPNRLAATAALAMAVRDWRRFQRRASEPPRRVYRCSRCGAWHLTHNPERKEKT